jgi:hypothetical protein
MNIVDAGMTPAIARQLIAMGGWRCCGMLSRATSRGSLARTDMSNDKTRDAAYRAQPPHVASHWRPWYSYARIEPFATMR